MDSGEWVPSKDDLGHFRDIKCSLVPGMVHHLGLGDGGLADVMATIATIRSSRGVIRHIAFFNTVAQESLAASLNGKK